MSALGRVRTVALIKCHSQFSLFAKAKIEARQQEYPQNVTDYREVLHGRSKMFFGKHLCMQDADNENITFSLAIINNMALVTKKQILSSCTTMDKITSYVRTIRKQLHFSF